MVSDLDVRRGGLLSVETESLIAEAVRLSAAAHLVEGWASRTASLRGEAEAIGDDGGRDAAIALDTAQAGFAAAGRAASELSHALGLGAVRYATAEGLAAGFTAGLDEAGRRVAAGLLGSAASAMALPIASAAAITLGPIALGSGIALVFDHDRSVAAIGSLVEEHGLPILSDPAFVGLVRAAADQADEFVAGLFRSQGLFAFGGELDAPENAGLLLAAAGVVGLLTGSRTLRETSLSTPERVPPPAGVSEARRGVGASGDSAPVRGYEDLADRIPPSDAGGPQVRIERYDGASGPRWIVYSTGTADFGMTPAAEPYDMTANLFGVAGASALHDLIDLPAEAAASERAVRAAMVEAGVGAGDPVIVVGHSAGGMVAANLAADSDPALNVVGAVNFGGPAAQVATGGTPVVSVAHAEDLVPATGGTGVTAHGSIVVERELGAALPVGSGSAVPAHALEEYRATARMMDRDDDEDLEEFRGLVAGFTDGSAPTDVSYWRVERSPVDQAR